MAELNGKKILFSPHIHITQGAGNIKEWSFDYDGASTVLDIPFIENDADLAAHYNDNDLRIYIEKQNHLTDGMYPYLGGLYCGRQVFPSSCNGFIFRYDPTPERVTTGIFDSTLFGNSDTDLGSCNLTSSGTLTVRDDMNGNIGAGQYYICATW